MILDILSVHLRTITGIFIDPIVLYLSLFYCHILIVPRTPCSPSSHSFLFWLSIVPLWTVLLSPPVAQTFLVPHVEQQALTCISSLHCTLWSHSSFSLTVVPGQFTLLSQSQFFLTHCGTSLLYASCAYQPTALFTHPVQSTPVTSPDVSTTCCSSVA